MARWWWRPPSRHRWPTSRGGRAALREPLAGPSLDRLVAGAARVAVVFPDLTRPMPNTTVLPPLLDELERAGAGPERVDLLCATGTHRSATDDELADLVGAAVVDRYRIHQHRSGKPATTSRWARSTGCPSSSTAGMWRPTGASSPGSSSPTSSPGGAEGRREPARAWPPPPPSMEAHSPARIADPRATWLTSEGNPVHEFVRAATDLCPPDLSVDVTIDRRRRADRRVRRPPPDRPPGRHRRRLRGVTQRVPGRFDVVLTTNGGHPLDRNLYQSVKGLAAAERVVSPGGIIVMAAACGDGVPDDGAFARILAAARGVEQLARPDGPAQVDGWQSQVLGRVLGRAEVWLYAEGLTEESIRTARMVPVDDVAAAVAEALARSARAADRPAAPACCPAGP